MRLKFGLLLTIIVSLVVACSPANDSAPTATTQPTLQGSVDITSPASGSIIYSESIFVAGTSGNVGEDGFQIRVIAPDDSVLAEANIQPSEDDTWFVELVHEYTGDPTEVTLVATGTLPDNPLDYDIESIALAPLDLRPDGTFGNITSPEDGVQVGGDSILIAGRGSGFFENTFGLSLVDAEGDTIVEIPVTLNNPNFIDDVLWEAELPREGFLGNATIRMTYQDMESGDIITLDEVEVVVGAAAG
ncbi:MAG: hypothetical protein AAF846_13820 [Chloroflexota bacterium]